MKIRNSAVAYLLSATVVATLLTSCATPGSHITPGAAPQTGELIVNHLDISQDMPSPGDNVTVSADVVNAGKQPGTFPVNLALDGKVVKTQNVYLTAGGEKLVNFSMRAGAIGTYLVSIGKWCDPMLVGPVYSELTP